VNEIVIAARGITKAYGHVQALTGASITVRAGEVVALVGDNGAGKSTLLKILSGALGLDRGELQILGKTTHFRSVRDAHAAGLETVYQDLALAPDLTIAESIYLGHERLTRRWQAIGILDRKSMIADAAESLLRLGISIPDGARKIRDLSGGQRQAVAVARAVKWAAKAVLMDEPTAALGVRQTEIVMRTIAAAASSGLAILIVSHDMPRMLEAADRIAVMRLGAVVADLNAKSTSIPEVVGAMLGATTSRGDSQ
jgi:simple sugar transport system ATP-binding protein